MHTEIGQVQTCPTLERDSSRAHSSKLIGSTHISRKAPRAERADAESDTARESAFLCDDERDETQNGELSGGPDSTPALQPEALQSLHSEPALPTEADDPDSLFENAQPAAWVNGTLRGRRPIQAGPATVPDLGKRWQVSDCPNGPNGVGVGAGSGALHSGPGLKYAAAAATRSGPGALGAGAMRSGTAAAAAAVVAAKLSAGGTRSGPSAIGHGGGSGAAAAAAAASAVATAISDRGSGEAGCGGEAAVGGNLAGQSSSSYMPGSPPAPLTGGGLTADGSQGAWVDTFTMWSSVQRHGAELQRRKRLMEEAPQAKSCVGTPFKVTWPRRLAQRARTQLIVASRVAAKDPYTVIVPVVLLVCMLAFGLWGVFSVAYAIRDGRRQAAYNAAVDFSNTLKSHIAATVAPASTIATLIKLNPRWPEISETFYDVAPALVMKGRQNDAILTIVMAPQGVVQAIVPPNLPAWGKVVGLDLLREKAWRNDALKTVMLHDQGMVMTGPSRLRAGMMGIVTRYAVFIPNAGPDETFGFNGSAYNCTPCYIPTNSTAPSQRFWGFSQLNVDWEVLIRNVTHMYDLCERDGLHFNMTYIDPVNGTNRSIAACGDLDRRPVFVTINTMQNTWVLAVSDSRGWVPDWMPLVLAVVVLVSLWISITMAIILINRREHMWLLQAMLPKKVIATLRRGEEYAEAFECVTVLFSDIVSYTTLASEMEPIKVVRLLNEMYSAFDALVDQYECYKVETIGDAFMAVCGTQGEDAIAAAVKMAHLAQAMVDRTRVLVSADGQKIQIRIGMHSGPVVGAVVGFKMPHFCLCGDTVNTASRMESNSRPMRIHISDATAQLLAASGQGFAIERRGPIQVKGKGTMVTHWLLPDASTTADKAATVAGTGTGILPAPLPAEALPSLPPSLVSPALVKAPEASSELSRTAVLSKTSDATTRTNLPAGASGKSPFAVAAESLEVDPENPSAARGAAGAATERGSEFCQLAERSSAPSTAAASGTLSRHGGGGGGGASVNAGSCAGCRNSGTGGAGTPSISSQSRSVSLVGTSLPLFGIGRRRNSELGIAGAGGAGGGGDGGGAGGDSYNSNMRSAGGVNTLPRSNQNYTSHNNYSGSSTKYAPRGLPSPGHQSPGLDAGAGVAGGSGAAAASICIAAGQGSPTARGGSGPSMVKSISGAPPPGTLSASGSGSIRKPKSTSVDLRLFQLGSPMQRASRAGSKPHG